MVRSRASRKLEWHKKIMAWRASGEGIAAWCRSNGVAQASFYYWRKRFAISETTRGPSVHPERLSFVELGSENPSTVPWIEINARGLKISLERSCDIDAFRHCLKILIGTLC